MAGEAWKILIDGAGSKNVIERSDAIAALATIRSQHEAVKLIETGLRDKSADVRRIAATALGDMNAKGTIPALQVAMDDKNPAVSFAAAEALWKMGDRSGRHMLYAVLEGTRHAQQGIIASNVDDALNKLHNPKALAMIGVNEGAGALLGPFSEGLTIAEALAKDSTAPARALSATLLGQDPTAQTEKILETALRDKSPPVRAAAAKALGGFSDPQLLPRLAPLLKEKKSVRFMVAAAIVRLEHRLKQH